MELCSVLGGSLDERGVWGRTDTCIVQLSPFAVHLKLSQHCMLIGYTPIHKDLFMKIGDTKGACHAKIGTIKDKSGKDLRQVEEIKKRWQEYTEELYKKALNDPDKHNGVVTHPEPDILKYNQVGLRKHCYEQSQGGDGIPGELFQILKDDTVKVLH